MNWQTFRDRLREMPMVQQIPATILIGAIFGAFILPALIYVSGVAVLGRIEGSSLTGLYGSIYKGLVSRSSASWIVVLGPGLLVLLFQSLRAWWRRGSYMADS